MKRAIIGFVILITFLSLWIILSLKYVSENEFGTSTLVSLSNFKNITFTRSNNLLRGDVAFGEFISEYPKLGTISIRFLTHERINNDKLEFRLKEEGSESWYYKAVYNTDQFQPGQLFPFGFPPIEESLGKKYIFELESLSGTTNQSITVDPGSPSFASHHVFSKKSLIRNRSDLSYFLKHKIKFLLNDKIFLHFSLVYALPLIFFLVLLSFKTSYQIPVILLVLLMVRDIQQPTIYSDFMYVSVFFIWISTLLKYRLDSHVLVPQVLILLLATVSFAVANQYVAAEKMASWLYLSLIITLSHHIISSLLSIKNTITLHQFLSDNFSFIIKVMKYSSVTTQAPKLILLRIVNFFITISVWSFLGYNIFLVIKHSYHYYLVFADYFINHQSELFFSMTGRYLVGLYLFSLLSFWYLSKKFPAFKKVFIAIAIIYLSARVENIIFQKTTPFRDEVIIWKVNGSEVIESWVDIFISGRNLKELPFQGKVYINGIEQRIINWSDQEVVFRTDPTITQSGSVYLITYDGKVSNKLDLTYNWNR